MSHNRQPTPTSHTDIPQQQTSRHDGLTAISREMAAHLPKPSLTFSVPSVHDGVALDCRVYHPPSLAASPRPDTPPWQRHAAVVAHPYAPLGGCYDDPVVDIVSATLLRLGFLVATFNFRFAVLSLF